MSNLISREETYKVLTDYYHHTTETQHSGLREALGRVPTANQWIPCSERLPEENELVAYAYQIHGRLEYDIGSWSYCAETDGEDVGWVTSSRTFRKWYGNECWHSDDSVKAWMPITPYKGGG